MTENVVKLTYLENTIAIVAMEDRESKNTFSKSLVSGLLETFAYIHKNTDVKVVILQGYDNNFCCGGTQDELLELTEGKVTFADFGFYRLLLDCPVPVIAAMQGHALGAGLAFGTSADLLIMAEEAFYSTNFMKYGFTPGFGATYFMPQKLGITPSNNMLFGAQNYQGIRLKELGVPVNFIKKAKVIEEAVLLAKTLAKKSRPALIALKTQLTSNDQKLLPEFIAQEIAMHKITFAQPEVKHKILELFGK